MKNKDINLLKEFTYSTIIVGFSVLLITYIFKTGVNKMMEAHNTIESTEIVPIASWEPDNYNNTSNDCLCIEIILHPTARGAYPVSYLVNEDLGNGEYEPLYLPIEHTTIYMNNSTDENPIVEISKNKHGNVVKAIMYIPKSTKIQCSGFIK